MRVISSVGPRLAVTPAALRQRYAELSCTSSRNVVHSRWHVNRTGATGDAMSFPTLRVDRHEPLHFIVVMLVLATLAIWMACITP